MHVLLLVVKFVVLNADDYFALVAFQMARPTLQIIVMRHCQEKVLHMLLLVVRFAVLDVDDYFTLVVFQMAAFHVITFCSCTVVQTKKLLENYLLRKVKRTVLFGCYVRHLRCLHV